MESLGGFAIAAVVLYSGFTVIMRGNPPGSLFSFITSVIMLYEPMKRVARLHVDLSSSLFGVGMLYDFLDAREFEEDAPHAPDLTVTRGGSSFATWCSAIGPGSGFCIRSASSPKPAGPPRWWAAQAAASRQ